MTAAQARTVFVSGIFNILHPGHVRLLRFASELGDRLVVGVLPDRLASDVITTGENSRLEAIQSLRMVDESFIIEDTVTDTIRRLRPHVVVKGREHVTQENEELAVLSTYGGQLVFSSGDSFFNSRDLIRSEVEGPRQLPIDLPAEFMAHHGITREGLIRILSRLSEVRVLVVGDSIIDEYVSCHPLGMSQEDPTLVVKPIETHRFIGGAAIVAGHAGQLGKFASLHSVAGVDEHSLFLQSELSRLGVAHVIHEDLSRPTTTKRRYRAGQKTLLKVSTLRQDAISQALQEEIVAGIESAIECHDLLIFSDFNYGVLPQSLVDRLTTLGRLRQVMMVADSQASSQIGDVSRFAGMDLLSPTEYEARVSARNFDDGLIVLADQLRQKANARVVLMTLAEDGVLIRGSSDTSSATTDRIPALNPNPIDVAGAGDSLMVVSSMALAAGATLHEAALLGSVAAAVQVGETGNHPLSVPRILNVIRA